LAIEAEIEFWARDVGKAVERGDVIIMIDVLRSGTSILNAFANGAKFVIPVASLREAYRLRSQNPEYVLAGERGGYKLKWFDLGNSPLEFASEKVSGKSLVMTTTSGTSALVRSRLAKWVLVGAFLNAGATADKAEEFATKEGVGVSFVLAGDRGRFSLEDFLCAGAIAGRFTGARVCFSDKAEAAFLSFRQVESDLCQSIMEAEHAKYLMRLGLKRDIAFSCQLNSVRIVPVYRHGRITLR
jgi:2-phosphosulfolactate phosphatase